MNSQVDARRHWLKVVIPLAVWAGLRALPSPAGLAPGAWAYFALFGGVIAGIITEPLPAAAVGLIGVSVATVAGYVAPGPGDSIQWALSGFSNTTVWLIFGAFMLSMGYEKTGLGRRLALLLVRAMGRRTLGLGYAITCADLILAPGTPSNTARGAGTIFPIVANLPALYGSEPGPTARRIGSYLMWTAFATTAITSSLFLTALAPNPLAVTLVRETTGIAIDWTGWVLGALPIAGPLLALLPLLVYWIYPPEIKNSPEVPRWAARELALMGPLARREMAMAGLVATTVVLWVFGGRWLSATTVVLIAISLMVMLRVVSWDEVLGNRAAWNVLVWFATLVTLAGGLNRVGFVDWAAQAVAGHLGVLPPLAVVVALVLFFFFSHYLFASLTAHTVAVLPVVLAIGKTVPGVPAGLLAPLLCYSIGFMGVLTPYATGPAPVYYGSGYISRGDFWKLGFLFGTLFLAVLLAAGIPYLSGMLPGA